MHYAAVSYYGVSAPATDRPRQFFALRPLELKQFFDFAIRLYRANFSPMFIAMALADLPMHLLGAVTVYQISQLLMDVQALQITGKEPDSGFFLQYADRILPLLIFTLCALAYYLFALPLGLLACSKLAVQTLLNEPWTLRQALDFARSRYWPTQACLFLYALPLLLVSLLLLLPVLAFSQSGNDSGTIGSAVLALFLIWMAGLATMLLFFRFMPVLSGSLQAIEAPPPGGVFEQASWYLRRSWELTRGYYGRLLGMAFLCNFAIGIFQNGIFRTVNMVVQLVQLASASKGGFESAIKLMTENPSSGGLVFTVIVASATAMFFPPIQIAFQSLLTVDLLCRKEGFDIEHNLGIARVDD